MNNLVIIFCLAFVIIYLVVSIYNKPNFEFFSPAQSDEKKMNLENLKPVGDNELIDAIEKEIVKNKEMFYKQESHQNVQNNQIKELKQEVDKLKQDLMMLIKNENNDNLHSNINQDDSLSQMLSVSGNSSLGSSFDGFGNSGSKGKNYNLNFNLQD